MFCCESNENTLKIFLMKTIYICKLQEREREREKILSNFVYCKLIKIDLVSRKMMKF